MKQIFFAFVLLCAPSLFAGTGSGPSNALLCGVNNDAAFVARNCGNIGGTIAPSSPTNISSVPFTVLSSGNYQLTGNLGADPTACAIVVTGNYSSPVTIWLGGFVLTGRVCANGNLLGGFNIYGGTINCSWAASGSNTGCIRFEQNGGTITAPSSIHHITVSNSIDPGAFAAQGAMQIVIQPTAYTGGGYIFSLYNVSCTTPTTNTDASRVQCANILGANSGTVYPVEVYSNNFLISGTSAAAQGIVLYCFNAPSYVHNNYLVAQTNSTNADARLGSFDGDGGVVGCSNGNFARYNWLEPNNNRAWRQRNSYNDIFENNIVVNADNGGHSTGVVHTGDMTNTNDDVDANFAVLNNRFTIKSGSGIWGRGQRGRTGIIAGNTVLCDSGGCSTARFVIAAANTGSETTEIFNLQNNTVDAAIGAGSSCTGGTATNSCTAAATVINYCNSGTVGGLGTSNVVSPCP